MSDLITYSRVSKAVANSLRGTRSVIRTEAFDEISESVPDTPLLQIYADSGETDSGSADTMQSTFGAGIRQTKMTLFVDGYAKQRSNLSEDLLAQMDLIDAIDERLSTQVQKPYFGLQGIQQFRFSWQRSMFVRGDSKTEYAGVRFTLELTIF